MDHNTRQIVEVLAQLPQQYFSVAAKSLATLFRLDAKYSVTVRHEILLLFTDKPSLVITVVKNNDLIDMHKRYNHDLTVSLNTYIRQSLNEINVNVHVQMLGCILTLEDFQNEETFMKRITTCEVHRLCELNHFALKMTRKKFKCVSRCIFNNIRRQVLLVSGFPGCLHTVKPSFTIDEDIESHLLVGEGDVLGDEVVDVMTLKEKGLKDERKVCADIKNTTETEAETFELTDEKSSGYDTDRSESDEDQDDLKRNSNPALHEGCEACRPVVRAYRKLNKSMVFVFHVENHILSDSTRTSPEKRELLTFLRNTVSALRNGTGGIVLFHIYMKDMKDKFLGYFDESLQKDLYDLLQDGSQYTDIYFRRCLPEEITHNKVYIVELKVSKSKIICTADFKTKVRDDHQNRNPTISELKQIFCSPRRSCTPAQIRGLPRDVQLLHESRYTELKVCIQGNTPTRDVEEFVNYIWNDLKLKVNVTSMSKLGGSIYFGISEAKECQRNTKILNILGFELHVPRSQVIKHLMNKLKLETIFLNRDGQFIVTPDEHMVPTFHEISSSPRKYILEVAVGKIDGILFMDKDGPETYIAQNRRIKRMGKMEWNRRFQTTLME